MAEDAGRRVATVAETRERLGLGVPNATSLHTERPVGRASGDV
jgi:hypothetical protein